jgi:hypothetical protein
MIMTRAEIEAELRARLPRMDELDGRALFDLGADGSVLIDARQDPPTVTSRDQAATDTIEADARIRLSIDVMTALLSGTLGPGAAYGQGRLEVTGSMDIALRVAAAFDEE